MRNFMVWGGWQKDGGTRGGEKGREWGRRKGLVLCGWRGAWKDVIDVIPSSVKLMLTVEAVWLGGGVGDGGGAIL